MSDIELIPGSVKAAMKVAEASSSDLWKVRPDVIKVMPNYNARIRNEKYNQRVREIADSIKANGFYVDKPLSGFIGKDESNQDTIYLVGGHRRLEAALIAIAEGAEVPSLPIIIKPKGTNLEDLTVDLKVGNDGEPLTTLEQALVCQRLAAFNWESSQIGSRLGYTNQRVDELLSLAAAPKVIRDHVAADRISASLAIELISKHGAKAKEMIEKLVNGQTKKVTAKDVPELRFKQTLKKQAAPLFEAVTKVQLDPAFVSLAPETQQAISNLIKEIQK